MDLKLLSTVLTSGKAPSPPASLHSSSRPAAFPSPLPLSGEDLSSSPLPSSEEDISSSPSSVPLPSSSSQATAKDALEEAIHQLPPFTPYSAQVPWHSGIRAFFSQVFPKYGHYCGPNWSSGRSSGSLFWDKPPVDWLDYCCLCHDIGYDSHDQAQLYKADLEFLECLQKMPPPKQKRRHGIDPSQKGHEYSNGAVAGLCRNLYITGLQTFLLPYRRMLLRDMAALPRKE